MIRATAPGRANLIGNPSDQYGGSTLSCSLPLRASVEIERSNGALLETRSGRFRLDGDEGLESRGDDFDIARAVLRHLDLRLSDVRVRYDSEIPRQSGIAGSTALVVTLLQALLRFRGETPNPYALAERARRVEKEELGIQCGYVDQYLCVFGGLCYVDLRGKELDSSDDPLATVESLSTVVPRLPFLLAYTGVQHSSDAVHRPLRQRWLDGEEEVITAYRRIAELGREGKRALVEADFSRLGSLMNENHAIQRDLGGSGPANDRLIEAACKAGASGAKLAGAGDAGTIVALWEEEDTAPLEETLRKAGAVAFFRPQPVPGVQVTGAITKD